MSAKCVICKQRFVWCALVPTQEPKIKMCYRCAVVLPQAKGIAKKKNINNPDLMVAIAAWWHLRKEIQS